MPNNLARFERLAQESKMRAAMARESQLTAHEKYARDMSEMIMRGAEYRRQLEQQGPPDGCYGCWRIRESWPWNGSSWEWGHGDLINPEMRVLKGEEDLGAVEVCMHPCHGPEGRWIPIVAYG